MTDLTVRAERQAKIDRRVADLRAKAAKLQAEADRIHDAANKDSAFWTQPAYGNAAGRAFARQRDRARARLMKGAEMAAEARELLSTAASMERRGAVVAGDAAAVREAVVASTEVAVGQMVQTTFYGVRKVIKVNAKSVLVEAATGPLKVEKQYISAVSA